MKIHLDNVNLSSRSGPNSFAKRFSDCVTSMGHTIVGSGNQADVSLVFIERSGQPLAKKVVHRLDGIWFAPNQFHTHNKRIKETYVNADRVVWQSDFDKNMTTKWWGYPNSGSVIRNGCPLYANDVSEVKSALQELRKKHEKVFVCSANWHPQKRLRENVNLFSHLKKNFYPTACLIVMGTINSNLSNEKDVYVTGNIPHEACIQVFKESDWMIHLGWLDHCPNTVVESLSVKTPVICTEDGGTKELVGSYGLVLHEKEKYQYQLADYDNPPELDIRQIQTKLPEKSHMNYNIDVSIETCVKEYVRIFEEIS